MSDVTYKNPVEILITTRDLLSVTEAARELGVAKMTLYRWYGKGEILGVKLGGGFFIPRSEVERIKDERGTKKESRQ